MVGKAWVTNFNCHEIWVKLKSPIYETFRQFSVACICVVSSETELLILHYGKRKKKKKRSNSIHKPTIRLSTNKIEKYMITLFSYVCYKFAVDLTSTHWDIYLFTFNTFILCPGIITSSKSDLNYILAPNGRCPNRNFWTENHESHDLKKK